MGKNFAVVDVEDLGGSAEPAIDLEHFVLAPYGKRTAGALPVADIAVGGGDELDVVTGLRPTS